MSLVLRIKAPLFLQWGFAFILQVMNKQLSQKSYP